MNFFDGQWNALLTPFVCSLQHIGIVYGRELIDFEFSSAMGWMSQTMPSSISTPSEHTT